MTRFATTLLLFLMVLIFGVVAFVTNLSFGQAFSTRGELSNLCEDLVAYGQKNNGYHDGNLNELNQAVTELSRLYGFTGNKAGDRHIKDSLRIVYVTDGGSYTCNTSGCSGSVSRPLQRGEKFCFKASLESNLYLGHKIGNNGRDEKVTYTTPEYCGISSQFLKKQDSNFDSFDNEEFK